MSSWPGYGCLSEQLTILTGWTGAQTDRAFTLFLAFYIIDYNKQSFLYVSDAPLFLSGYEQDEVLEMGYEFYNKVVPPEDLEMLVEMNEKAFEFFYNLPTERRDKGFISYDYRLKRKEHYKC